MVESVYSAVRTGSLYKADYVFVFKSLTTSYLGMAVYEKCVCQTAMCRWGGKNKLVVFGGFVYNRTLVPVLSAVQISCFQHSSVMYVFVVVIRTYRAAEHVSSLSVLFRASTLIYDKQETFLLLTLTILPAFKFLYSQFNDVFPSIYPTE